MRRVTFLIVVSALFTGTLSPAAQGQEAGMLQMLRVGHPRLLVLDEDVARLKETIKVDPTAGKYFNRIRAAGDELLNKPVAQRVIVGPRLLHVSRQVLDRVTTLAGLYRLTGETKYADRARDEMLAAARFEDWNPSHFLDVAEMTNALGIGYDWLFDRLTPDERAQIRGAIIEKGLKPGLAVYEAPNGWHKRTNNWNQVCNGGLTVGALAIADEEPELAAQILAQARKSIPHSMREFAPDGGYIEGPGYWNYGTRYNVFFLAALDTALGTDLGFSKMPGVTETGLFRIHCTGPLGKSFNFGDGGEGVGPAWQMFYLARTFDRPAYAAHERAIIDASRIEPLHLMTFNAAGSADDVAELPTAALFRRINVAFLRSAWNDDNAAYVGFKGGDNAASHANLDLGAFIYDANGVRWAMELGGDDYNLPGYFGKHRWTYYRLRTEGQNTLTLNGENQDLKAKAPIVAFSAGPKRQFAVADLSDGYESQRSRVMRGVELIGQSLLVQDELSAAEPVEVVWHLHTPTKIELGSDPRRATLRQAGKALHAKILSPAEASFAVAIADPPPTTRSSVPRPGDEKRKASEKLTVRLPDKTSEMRLIVLLSPDDSAPSPEISPLRDWIKTAPLSD